MVVEPVSLTGRTIRLEPLSLDHVEGFREHIDPELFLLFAGTVIYEKTEEAIREYVQKRLSLPDTVSFAMILLESGKPVGHSSYMSIRAKDRVVEIGATWIGKAYQGTKVNPEAKYLMLRHAFETLGCHRVELKTDERNLHSQAAIAKLGAVKEGVLRKHSITAHGYVRNAVMFSILDEEWPKVKAGLEARLDS